MIDIKLESILGEQSKKRRDCMHSGKRIIALFAVALMVMTVFPTIISFGTADVGATTSSRGGLNADIEANNNMSTANTLDGTVTSVTGKVTNADLYDWWQLSLTNTAGNADHWNLKVDFDGPDGVTNTGMSVRLMDGFGFILDFKRDAKVSELNAVGGVSGTNLYYLNITNDMAFGIMDYYINLTKASLTTNDNDNDPGNATVISTFPFEKDDTTDGDDYPTDYQDFYNVSVTASPTAKDLLIVHTDPSGAVALWTELFLQNGSKWTPIGTPHETQAQTGKDQTVTYAATGPGVVLIRIWNTNTSVGGYHIFVNKLSVNIKECAYAGATVLAFDASSVHTGIGNGSLGEVIHSCDWYKFTAHKGQFMYVNTTSKDYSGTVKLPKIIVSLYNSDGTTEYAYDPLKNDPTLDPIGHVYSTATDDNKNNYIKVEIFSGGGAGAYNFTFVTDKKPVNKTTLVKPIDMAENGNDSSIQLKKVFTDPENDTLAFDWWIESEQGMNDTGNFTVTVLTDEYMTVKLKPRAGVPFGWRGQGLFCARATDTYGLNDTACWLVKVIGENHAPFLSNKTIDPVVLKLDDEPQYRTNDTIDLDNFFSDWDTEKLHYIVEGPGVNLSYKRAGANNYLANATVTMGTQPVLRIIFSLETNGWQHSGGLRIMPTDECIASGWTGEVTLTFFGIDAAELQSLEGLNLTIRVSKKEGTAPKWQTFEMKWTEDMVLEKDFLASSLLTDVDLPDDKITFTFEPVAPENITIEQVAGECDGVTKCKFKFTPAPNWFGEIPIVINATDEFGKSSETKDMKLEVLAVDDAPVLNKTYPSTHEKSVNEGETMTFTVNVTDVDTPGTTLKFVWMFEGKAQTSVTGPDYTWTPGSQDARDTPYNITVKVTYAGWTGSLEWSWAVKVVNVNMAPKIGKILKPTDNQSFVQGTEIDLTCELASDPDGDTVTYKWFVDGGDVPDRGTAVKYDTNDLGPGNHTIKLQINDGVNLVEPFTTVNITITKKSGGKKPGGLPGFEAPLVVGAVLAAIVVATWGTRRRRDE